MRVTSILEQEAGKFLAVGFALCVIVAPLAGCAAASEENAEPAAAQAADQGTGMAEPAGEHVDEATGDFPSRADEVARDEFSKPQEVYDYLGIGPGSTVVDINAGFGYNTYLLSERVGSEGRVYAERGAEALEGRMREGDLSEAHNIVIPDSWDAIPDGSVDAVVAIREYHLIQDSQAFLASVMRALKPGGVLGIVEVRLNQPYGHDMSTHRMGEQTIIEELEGAGFEYVGASDILRRDDDDYTTMRGPFSDRAQTDRMLLKFAKPQ